MRLNWMPALVMLGLVALGHAEEAALPALIAVDAQQTARIDTVLQEMERNHGGTLVCDPADAALDSAAFVQRYLRRFGGPQNLPDYDYRFERLLSRLSQYPAPLADPRLDHDIWQAYRTYESVTHGATSYRKGDTIHGLDNARDLLWMYLTAQAGPICADPSRRAQWLDRLLVDPGTPAERLARSFAVLQLIAAVRGVHDHPLQVRLANDVALDAGSAGLRWFAERLGLGCIVWGINPATLPRPRIDAVNVSGRMTSFDMANVVDQESWSQDRHFFTTVFSQPVGQRARYMSVHLPEAPSDDGLFCFASQGVVNIWRKRHMVDAMPQMLEAAAIIDTASRYALAQRMGATELAPTVVRERANTAK